MNQISEQNIRWLQVCSKAARVFAGIVLLVFTINLVVGWAKGYYGNWQQQGPIETPVRFILWVAFNLIPAIFALGIAQLITFVLEEQEQPGWMLRHLDKVMYLYAILLTANEIWFLKRTGQGFIGGVSFPVVFLLYPLFPTIVIALVSVGMGLLLRRVLSIIEESKTLI